MFGSEILETMIGMVFIFLTLSVIVSSAQELLEGLVFRMRSRMLVKGLQQMFYSVAYKGGDPSKGGDVNQSGDEPQKVGEKRVSPLLRELVNHPLLCALGANGWGIVGGENPKWLSLPSYLPPGLFATALLDILRRAVPGGVRSGAAGCFAKPDNGPDVPAAPAPVADQTLRDILAPAPEKVYGPTTGDPVRTALLVLADAAGDDIQRFRQLIEEWYKSTMDRVSGWYRRWTRLVIFVLGLGITIALNADTVVLFQYLSQHKEAREKLLTAAEAAAKRPPERIALSEEPLAALVSPAAFERTPEAEIERLKSKLKEVQGYGLPLGWGKDVPTPESFGGWCGRILGWLLTACAIALGAPFWFDLLNRFVNFRAAVKPGEQTQVPATSGTGGTPTASVRLVTTAAGESPPNVFNGGGVSR